jgi:branched-chain amino acid aminotransferase
LDRHLQRIKTSLQAIDLAWPVDADRIRGDISGLLEANGLRDARIRLTITGGPFDGSIRLRRSGPPTVVISASILRPPSAEDYARGVHMSVAAWRQAWSSPLARVKTIQRLEHLVAKEEALKKGAFDALILDDRGGLAEGTASNIFIVEGDRVMTPSLEGPLLPGVTREAVLQVAREIDYEVQERFIPATEIWQAEEVFVTATSFEVLAVRAVDGRMIGNGVRGEATRGIHEAFRDLVRRETAGTNEFVKNGGPRSFDSGPGE